MTGYKKGQTAVFLLIAVIFITMIVIFLMILMNSEKNIQSSDRINFNVFQNSVTDCLNQKLEHAIYLASRQGGLIYSGFQGGNTPLDPDASHLFLKYSHSYYSYYVRVYIRSMSEAGAVEPEEVLERVTGFPFNCSYPPYNESHNTIENPRDGCEMTFPLNSEVNIRGDMTQGDGVWQQEIRNIFKTSLESYLLNKAKDCIDSSKGSDFEVIAKSEDKLNVSVFFNKYDISAIIKFPVTVVKKGTGETKSFSEFKARIDGRFKDLLDLIADVIYNETHFANYDPYLKKNNFEVRVIRNVSEDRPGDDIIEFVDNKTIIFGENLTFWIGRENRPPLIYELPRDSDNEFLINFSGYQQYSDLFNIFNNDECSDDALREFLSDFFNSTGFIKAIDPDEDRLEYSNNINQYKCSDGLGRPPYFNYNVSDGKYTVKVFVRLEPKFG